MKPNTQVSNPFPSMPVCSYGDERFPTLLSASIRSAEQALDRYLTDYDDHPFGGTIGVRGGHGSGKTHLLSYLSAKMRERRSDSTCLYARNEGDRYELYKQLIRQVSLDRILSLKDLSVRKDATSISFH